MNEISIIIDGVRYDAFDSENATCNGCELKDKCREHGFSDICCVAEHNFIYKLSQKKFER